tara:strand:- start:1624 stop:2067 length:444 start_codon:yes stop_codon:yes gene_type:complete
MNIAINLVACVEVTSIANPLAINTCSNLSANILLLKLKSALQSIPEKNEINENKTIVFIDPKLIKRPKLQFILNKICIKIIVIWPETLPPIKRNKIPENITPTNLRVIKNPAIVASPEICHANTEKHITSSQRAIPEEVPASQSLKN